MIKSIKTTTRGAGKTVTTVYLKGEAQWASVQKPKESFGKKKYSIDIEATESDLKTLQGLGLGTRTKLKTDPTSQKTYLTFIKNYSETEDGEPVGLTLIDENGKEGYNELVGNGSEVIVKVDMIPYDNAFGKGTAPRLSAVQVLKLVPYKKKSSVDPEGFEVRKNTASNEDDDYPFDRTNSSSVLT